MSEETAIALPAPTNLRLVALDPAQLQNSQKQLIDWGRAKIASVKGEIADLTDNLAIAKKAKWNTARPKAHLRMAEGRLIFYEKLEAALMAGFFIIPNFPCDIFAIRMGRIGPTSPSIVRTENYPNYYRPVDQKPELMEAGSGDYVNPEPAFSNASWPVTVDGKEKHHNEMTLHGWKDVDFPFVLAKPQVLNATQRAMALKIFDELGVCPQTQKSDPLVVGIIQAPKRRFAQKQVSFLVAWWLDTEVL